MKHILTLSILFAGITFFGFKSSELPITEGTIVYKIKEVKADDLNAMTKMMIIDSKCTMRFKDGWIHTEMKMPFIKQTTIIDGKAKKGLIKLEKFMDKIAVPMDQVDLDQQKKERGEIVSIDRKSEYKIIQGFNCQKVVIKTENGDELEMYFTDNIQPNIPNSRFQINGIDGFPLEMDMLRDGKKLRLVATSINTKSLKKHWFDLTLTKGFEVKDMDYLQEMQKE